MMEQATQTGEISKDRRLEILRILGSPTCGSCGKPKRPKMSHCRTCYYALPKEMQQALYQRFGDGYEEAYEESLVYLRKIGVAGQEETQAAG